MIKLDIPDAINCSNINTNFAQIPNYIQRSPDIKATAKVILGILLSNQNGWHSYIVTLSKMMAEGVSSISTGIKELEKLGYLRRYRYRDKITKSWTGSFWAYNNIADNFNIDDQIEYIEQQGGEVYFKSCREISKDATNIKPTSRKPTSGFLTTKNTNKNNTNKNLCEEAIILPLISLSDKDKLITPIQFDRFWNIYPRKPDKGKAKTAWDKLCKKNNRPTWKVIKQAILSQIKSDRWQDQTFIPYPATWINESRWLDNPEEMLVFKRTNIYDAVNASNRSRRDDVPKMKYKE